MKMLLGSWREHIKTIGIVDSVICDPPFSEKTHVGHNATSDKKLADASNRWGLTYDSISDQDVYDFVERVSPICRGWMVMFCDHILYPTYAKALTDVGRYVFAPIPFVQPGSTVRLTGDGPSSWTCWLVVSRPRARDYHHWGTLRGAYNCKPIRGKGRVVTGQKPLEGMREIVKDYSRPGDLVWDPFAGSGTTLLAAAMEGRNAIGTEINPETYTKACARLAEYARTSLAQESE
jgi:site-specific DNA-methyltransferase (adenine-specific)